MTCLLSYRSSATRRIRRGPCIAPLAGWIAAAVLLISAAGADERLERRRRELLEQMRALAEQTEVRHVDGGQPELKPNPIFRYDDQPRRFMDATMWVWTDAGRPAAFQKIEAKYHVKSNKPEWGYCFTAVAPELLSVRWPEGQTFRSTEAGLAFRPLPEGPPVAQNSAVRRRQLRELARRFSARMIIDPQNNVTQEMRLLTTPIFEYVDAKTESAGAVFGLATNGVNPDVLILLEPREEGDGPEWRFAPARMTSGGVVLRFDEGIVWETEWVNWDQAPFPTWTFFSTPRTPVAEEEAP